VTIMTVGSREPGVDQGSQHDAAGADSVDVEIDLLELRRRSRDYLVGHYLGLHITVVSVALGLAGAAAASLITRHSIPTVDLVLLWLLWLGSLLATAVAYAGTMVGAFALPSGVPSVTDLGLPLLMCVVEFLLFAVLIRQVTSFTNLSTLIDTWLVLMAAFGAIAMLSIIRAAHHFTDASGPATEAGTRGVTETGPYSKEALEIIDRYREYLERDRIGAAATGITGAIGAVLRLSGVTSEAVAYLFLLLIIALLVGGLLGHGQTSRMWRIRLARSPVAVEQRQQAELQQPCISFPAPLQERPSGPTADTVVTSVSVGNNAAGLTEAQSDARDQPTTRQADTRSPSP